MAKRSIKTSFDLQAQTVTFAAEGMDPTVFHYGNVGAARRARAEAHGWLAKLGDTAALGKGATMEQKVEEIEKMIAFMLDGGDDWNRRGSGGAGRKSEFDWTVEALAEVQGLGVWDILERLATQAEKHGTTSEKLAKKLSVQKDVAVKIAELKAGGGSGDDADELLDDLMND